MSFFKRFFLLGGVLLVASLFSALTPVASTAFAATTGTHSASRASTLSHTASSRLAPDICPPSCAKPINDCPPSQQEGSPINDWVKIIQFRLNAFRKLNLFPGSPDSYHNPLNIDGDFGSDTKAAVVDFQDQAGITDGGGAVGDRTWSAMGFCLGFSSIFLSNSGTTSLTSCPPSQSDGGSNTLIFVKAIQDLLNTDFDKFIFSNAPENFHPFLASDGTFGSDTKAAVVDFQDGEEISGGGGEVGQRTWSELRMCS
ncbi:MAG TPA: peptidoglycan-binding protein [Ktedonobacteraceae bacterium]|nr:peptidoglycan-binding protein [Ktedonobacteraceae bacterium]